MALSTVRLLGTPRGLIQPGLTISPLATRFLATEALKTQKKPKDESIPTVKVNKGGKQAPKTEQELMKEPALGVNKAYDEALSWFNGQRSAAQSRVELGMRSMESIKAAISTLKEKEGHQSDPTLVEQIAELQKNLEEKEASLSKDKKWLWGNDPVREKRARLGFEKVEIPSLETMSNEQWQAFKADSRLKHMGKYWGIFDDVLVGNPISPVVNLLVKYNDQLVQRGSEITPTLTKEKPSAKFGANEKNAHYTLLLVDADEPSEKEKKLKESVHWLVTNIPGKDRDTDLSKGTTVLDYIPPHPARGSNFHRFVFILFQQKDPEIQIENPPTVQDRFRTTASLIEKYSLKPVGFSFFRAQWDRTVSDTYRDVLGTKEPIWSQPTAPIQNAATRGRSR